MKNPYRKNKDNLTVEEQASVLIKNVVLVFDNEELGEFLKLNTPVDVLKQAIPIIINNEKIKFLDLFTKCCKCAEHHFKTTDKMIVLPYALLKFIKEIDNITTCVEV